MKHVGQKEAIDDSLSLSVRVTGQRVLVVVFCQIVRNTLLRNP
jgi:hypothetical protein